MAIFSKIEDALDRAKKISLEAALLVLFLGGTLDVLSVKLGSFKDLINIVEIRQILPTLLIWLIAVILLFALIYFFVFLLRRRTANTTDLKQEVTVAFIKALENSSFNPHRLEGANEQHSPRSTQ